MKLHSEAQHCTHKFPLECPPATPAVCVQYHCLASLAPNFATSHQCWNSLSKKGKIMAWFYSKFIFGKSMLNVIHHSLPALFDQHLQCACACVCACVCMCVHLSSSTKRKAKPTSPISFSATGKKNQFSGAARFATSLRNEYFLICLPGMAPGLQDNVDGWRFNAAECYFYWTGKTINFYFIGNDCAPCIKAVAATPRCPWIIAPSQQMLLCRNQFLG